MSDFSDIKEVWGTETRTVQSTCNRQETLPGKSLQNSWRFATTLLRRRGKVGAAQEEIEVKEEEIEDAALMRPLLTAVIPTMERPHGSSSAPRRGESCRMETRYRTVSYSCPRTELFESGNPDQRFHADVNFRFVDKTFDSYYTRGLFDLTLNERNLRVDVRDQGSGEPLVFLAKVTKVIIQDQVSMKSVQTTKLLLHQDKI